MRAFVAEAVDDVEEAVGPAVAVQLLHAEREPPVERQRVAVVGPRGQRDERAATANQSIQNAISARQGQMRRSARPEYRDEPARTQPDSAAASSRRVLS